MSILYVIFIIVDCVLIAALFRGMFAALFRRLWNIGEDIFIPVKKVEKPIDWAAIGAKLRDVREKKGMTTTQAAQLLGWTFPVLVEIEEGRRPVTSKELWELRAVYLEKWQAGQEGAWGEWEKIWGDIYTAAKEFGSATEQDIANEFGHAALSEWRQSSGAGIAARAVNYRRHKA